LKNLLVIVFILSLQALSAQKYNTLAGIRIGDDFGISFAQRIANKNTVELNIQPGTFSGNQMTALLVKQHYSLLTKRFNFFMGAGFYQRKYSTLFTETSQVNNSLGLALSFGAEFTIGRLSIATDYLPLITINNQNSNQRFYTTSGLSLRYVIIGRESSTKRFFKNIFKKKK
jgi:hypothetical protein